MICLPKDYKADRRLQKIWSDYHKTKVPDRHMVALDRLKKYKDGENGSGNNNNDKNKNKNKKTNYIDLYDSAKMLGLNELYFYHLKKKQPQIFDFILKQGDGSLVDGYPKAFEYQEKLREDIINYAKLCDDIRGKKFKKDIINPTLLYNLKYRKQKKIKQQVLLRWEVMQNLENIRKKFKNLLHAP